MLPLLYDRCYQLNTPNTSFSCCVVAATAAAAKDIQSLTSQKIPTPAANCTVSGPAQAHSVPEQKNSGSCCCMSEQLCGKDDNFISHVHKSLHDVSTQFWEKPNPQERISLLRCLSHTDAPGRYWVIPYYQSNKQLYLCRFAMARILRIRDNSEFTQVLSKNKIR